MVKDLDSFFGRNVSYSKEQRKIYDKLMMDQLSPFKGKNMSDIFVYAAVFGFKNNKRTELLVKRPQISAVAFTKSQKSILLTIAISDRQNIDVLFDADRVIDIIEQYANAGVEILEQDLLGNVHADAITKMSSDMKGILDKR